MYIKNINMETPKKKDFSRDDGGHTIWSQGDRLYTACGKFHDPYLLTYFLGFRDQSPSTVR